nr:aromatic amino acid aminotransferase DDB_G0287711-like [Leptinotarsa decemlineata]
MSQVIDYSYFMNNRSVRRRPALTREITKRQYGASKDLISLAEGVPNEVTFPFEKFTVKLKDGTEFDIAGQELTAALQYIPTQGYPPLVKSVKEFMRRVHDVSNWDKYETLVTGGSQEAMSKALEMILNEGDSILVQDPYYAGTEAILKPYNIKVIGVEQDRYGVIPKKLIEALENCKKYTEEGGGNMPKVIYLNPTGNLRKMHISSATIHSSVLSQVILEKLFQLWGIDGLLSYFARVRAFYKVRCDYTMASMERHLKNLCEWEVPTGGMFIWFKVLGVSDVYEMLLNRGLKKHITFIPGQNYMADPTKACNYVRASYSKASLQQIDKAMQILAELIREEHVLLRRKLDNLGNDIIR